ncbi:MAG: ABC transporter permease [Ancrocorticia sp.]
MSTIQTTKVTNRNGARPGAGAGSSGVRKARTPRNPALVVAKREIMIQLTDKAFWGGLAVTLVLVIAGFGAMMFLGSGNDTMRVAVADDRAVEVAELAGGAGLAVETVRVPADQLRAAIENGDADAALNFNRADGWTLLVEEAENPPAALSESVRAYQMEANATELGVSAGDVLAGSQLNVVPLGEAGADDGAKTIATIAFAYLFFLAAIGYGMQIAQSVVTEKESRIVEILAAAVPIRAQLIGKVVGNTMMALGQVIAMVLVSLVGLSFTPYKSLISLVAPVAGWFTLFFVVGFAALACLWAAAGAMATRVQDLNQTTTPLMMIIMTVFILGMVASGTTAVVASYVPIASSLAMPKRLLEGDAGWLEALGSLGVSVLFMAGAIWLGERIYRRGLLQTNGVLKLKDALSKGE